MYNGRLQEKSSPARMLVHGATLPSVFLTVSHPQEDDLFCLTSHVLPGPHGPVRSLEAQVGGRDLRPKKMSRWGVQQWFSGPASTKHDCGCQTHAPARPGVLAQSGEFRVPRELMSSTLHPGLFTAVPVLLTMCSRVYWTPNGGIIAVPFRVLCTDHECGDLAQLHRNASRNLVIPLHQIS